PAEASGIAAAPTSTGAIDIAAAPTSTGAIDIATAPTSTGTTDMAATWAGTAAADARTPADLLAEAARSRLGGVAVEREPSDRSARPVPGDTATARLSSSAPAAAGSAVTMRDSAAPNRGRVGTSRDIPADVRRKVWQRDQGRCTWTAKNGQRCGSRWKLEIDHITPAALGGPPTIDNLRLLCRPHNILYAQQVFGRRHMAKFTGDRSASGSKRVPEHAGRKRALGSSWTFGPGGSSPRPRKG
ncbi:MAG TPA: HNH endonuclease signature motif containing protein, partial [Anaeromyxobacteraceae bacterium]|nr:HNH endonuclease signature motif containing protein [Anaeromyxobacteraceae bacterium]